jgi:hypothetical protein
MTLIQGEKWRSSVRLLSYEDSQQSTRETKRNKLMKLVIREGLQLQTDPSTKFQSRPLGITELGEKRLYVWW